MSVASGKTKGSRTECPDVPSDLNLGALYTRGIVVGLRSMILWPMRMGHSWYCPISMVASLAMARGSKLKPSGEVCKVCAVVSCLCLCKCCFFNCMGFVFYISILYRNIEQLSNHKRTKNRKGMGPERLWSKVQDRGEVQPSMRSWPHRWSQVSGDVVYENGLVSLLELSSTIVL